MKIILKKDKKGRRLAYREGLDGKERIKLIDAEAWLAQLEFPFT